MSAPPTTLLVARLKAGSVSAYNALFARYYRVAVGSARRRLRRDALGRTCPEAFAGSVFLAVWVQAAARRAVRDHLSDTASFLRLLGLLTHQKVRRAVRDETRLCRDVGRTEANGAVLAAATARPAATFPEPPPGLTDRQRRLLDLWLGVWALAELPGELGCSLRTVHREWAEVGAKFRQARAAGGE